jgi:oligosaccharide repeat unit polymerase
MGIIFLFEAIFFIFIISYYRFNISLPIVLFTIFFYIKYLTRPLILYYYPETVKHSHIFPYLDNISSDALLVSFLFFLSLLVFYIGYYSRGKNYSVSSLYLEMQKEKIAYLLILTVTIVNALLLIYQVSEVGGLAQLIFQSRHGLFESTSYVFQKIPNIVLLLTTFLFLHVRKKKFSILILLINMGIVLAYGERGAVVITFLMIALYYLNSGKYSKKIFYIFIGGLLLLTTILGMARTYIFEGESKTSSNQTLIEVIENIKPEEASMKVLSAFNVETTDNFLVVYQDFDNIYDFHLGYDFFLGVAGIIPRYFWQDKPTEIQIGGWFRSKYMPGSGGKPISSLGDYWLNFWWLGVFIVMYLTGILFRRISDLTKQNSSSYSLFLLFFFYLSGFGIVSQNFLINFIFYGIPIFVFFILTFKIYKHKAE